MSSRSLASVETQKPLKAADVSLHEGNDLRARIWAINLDGPKHKLVVEKGWSLATADQAELSYKQFLYMNARYPSAGFVPTKLVDMIWHEHILDTAAYAEDCDRIFGRFLHHFPYFGLRGAEDAQKLTDAFAETRRAFIAELGIDPAQSTTVQLRPIPAAHAAVPDEAG